MGIEDILGHLLGLVSLWLCWFFYSHAHIFENGNIDKDTEVRPKDMQLPANDNWAPSIRKTL